MPRALSYGIAAILVAGSARAPVSLTPPQTIRLGALTCQELLPQLLSACADVRSQ